MRIISVFILSLFLLQSCKSVQRFNEEFDQPIPVKVMQKDIRFVQKKLFNMHPDIQWYTDPKLLRQSFDSLARAIQYPMKPMQYYFTLAPLVARVKQGHTLILPLTQKLDKAQKELYKDSKSPLSQFIVMGENNKYYIVKDNTIDTSLVLGAELLSINGVSPQLIADTFKTVLVGDGTNDSYVDYALNNKIDIFYSRFLGRQDSILIAYQKDGEQYQKTIYRNYKKELDSVKDHRDSLKLAVLTAQKVADSTALALADSATRVELLAADSSKQAALAAKENKTPVKKKWYDLGDTNEEQLKLAIRDSTTATLTIKGFMNLFPKPVYNKIFDSLKNLNIENLIIDLRGNPGGSLSEIHYLHGFLAPDSTYRTIDENTVTLTKMKMPLWTLGSSPVWSYPIMAPIALIDGIFYWSRTKSNHDGTFRYRMKQSKERPTPNNKFEGNIYMLVDGGTFSAAAITAANFKSDQRGLLVGVETGGAHNGTVAGKLPIFKRKKTKTMFRVGTMNIKSRRMDGQHGRGVVPDVEIKETVADKLANKDVALDYVLEQIKTKASTQQ